MVSDGSLLVDIRVDASPGSPARLQARVEAAPGITVLFGPSAAGKSTCLAAIAGLLTPQDGRIALGTEVLFDVREGVNVPPERRHVALVFQSLALFPHMNGAQNVAFGLPRPTPRGERRHKTRLWLERMRVAHLERRRPATYSGGEGQRVALARALASEPRLLLLDEPFSAMDAQLRQQLGSEVAGLVSELGIPAVLVTHDREDAIRLGARVVVLEAGRVVSEGRPEQCLSIREPEPGPELRHRRSSGRLSGSQVPSDEHG